ncbi:MAG TPA: YbfB/YjiJ family MFS transporter [Gammaproteobacteria bacterium]|jgi:MFS family permease
MQDSGPQRDRQLSLALSGMWMLAVAMGIGRFAFTPLLPMMEQDAGLSLSLGGWLGAANYLGYLLGAVTAIRLRAAPVWMLTGSLAGIAVATAAMGFTHGIALWLLLRGIAGVASAWVLVFASAWMLPQLGGRAATLGGVLFSGVGLGIVLAGLMCMGFLLGHWSSAAGWQTLGAASVVLSALALPALRGRPPRVAHAQQGQAPRAGGETVQLMLSYGIFGFGYIIPATFLPSMAKKLLPDPALFGWAWPVFGLAALLASLGAGRMLARTSNRSVWGVSHLVLGGGLMSPVLLPDLGGILLGALCVGSTFMIITSAGIQEARRLSPHDPAALVARFTVAFAAGQIVGPVCVSVLPPGAMTLEFLLGAATVLLVASGLNLLRIRHG